MGEKITGTPYIINRLPQHYKVTPITSLSSAQIHNHTCFIYYLQRAIGWPKQSKGGVYEKEGAHSLGFYHL
jgi:hypothetical protein